jgi:asparagine synthase (glutamine-hydrolysing)
MHRFLIDNANVLMDNFSMAASIEVRPPFLNKALAEYAMQIPIREKMGFLQSKKILRSSMKEILPPPILKQKKTGLVSPQSQWFKNELKPILLETERNVSKNMPFIRGSYINQIFHDHLIGNKNNSMQISAIVTLSNWLNSI